MGAEERFVRSAMIQAWRLGRGELMMNEKNLGGTLGGLLIVFP